MKKLFALFAIFALVLAGCDSGAGTAGNGKNEDNKKTNLTINNVSDYNLLGVEYASVVFGTINSGRDIRKEVNSGTRYVFFNLLINDQQVRCRTTNVLVCEEGANNEITITNNTQITVTGNDNTNSLRNIYDMLTRGTTLTIHNMSDYSLLDAEYASVNFGAINSGRDITKQVSAGTRPVFFNLLIKNERVRCRITQEMTCNEGAANEITITNDTSITTTVDGNTDTLKNIFDWLNRPGMPERPTVRGGDRSIRVSWRKMNDAASYRIYCGTTTAPPETPTINTVETSAIITDLINDVTYYVWLQTVNSSGVSDLSERVQVTPTTNFTVNSRNTFLNAVEIINDAADGIYTITVTGSFSSPPIDFVSGANKTIIITGDNLTRTVSNDGTTDFFVVQSGITLELENNITLNGNNKNGAVVDVQAGGTFIMNDGSTVRGSAFNGVYSAGTFTMNGGTITDNISSYYTDLGGVFIEGGLFTMNGGTISNNRYCGVGIYSGASFNMTDGLINGHTEGGVYNGGTFTMSGGTISNNTSSTGGGGVYNGGSFTMSGGTISNNTSSYSASTEGGGGGIYNGGTFTMSGGTISNNTFSSSSSAASRGGGGVYSNGSTFTMTAGLISGNAVNTYGGGVFIRSGSFNKTGGIIDDTNSTTVADRGRVAFVYLTSSTNRRREATAGPNDNLNSNVAGTAGGWE